MTTKKKTAKRAKGKRKAKKTGRTGATVASKAGGFLRALKGGARVILRTAMYGSWSDKDITDAAESVFASALVQRERKAKGRGK